MTLPEPLAHTAWTGHVDDVAEALGMLRTGPDPEGSARRLARLLEIEEIAAASLADIRVRHALVAICAASRALAETIRILGADSLPALGAAAPSSPTVPAGDGAALRRSVLTELLEIAALDLTEAIAMPRVGELLSDLADAAVASALKTAAGEDGPGLAIIALGKWGGRELNYASDIDLVFVHEGDPDRANAVATEVVQILSARTDGGWAYRVDADLRPEGAAGPLTRSLDSYRAYWARWAQPWEFQALLKARPVAGDRVLGSDFVSAASEVAFPERLDPEAVREIRAMKRRTENLVAASDEIKRGVGGIRDVEFSAQLLQLVHGRSDEALRAANTLEALRHLGDGGYIAGQDAAELTDAYRWLRHIEHRLQLVDLRQTHTLPVAAADRERLAKAAGYRDEPETSALERFERDLLGRRSVVRHIHERLFYRPLLEAFGHTRWGDRIERQLAALGFTDSGAARDAVADLTAGLSRRSRLMEQMLPVMMEWLSQSPDPDLGLAQLRSLVVGASDNEPLIAVLRDDPVSAERLCRLLGTARAAGRLVDRIPAMLSTMGGDGPSEVARDSLIAEALARISVRTDHDERVDTLHRFWGEHLLGTMAADVAGIIDEAEVSRRLSYGADALVSGSLAAARELTAAEGPAPPPMSVIALGRWGGNELTYAGDIDGVVVFASDGSAEAEELAARTTETLLRSLSTSTLGLPPPRLDLDLRPEGTKGAIVRSLDSFEVYWDRWALTWEHQALLRARAAAGDDELGGAFVAAALRRAHPEQFTDEIAREISAMKVRIEQERVPLGEDPDFHVKLGRGGLSDVEWAVQLLQMRHGHQLPEIRTTSTIAALGRLGGAGILDRDDADALITAYRFCTRVRNRLTLRAGRTRDSLPTDPVEEAAVARSLGYEMNPRTSLREEYRRVTRRARRIMEQVVFAR